MSFYLPRELIAQQHALPDKFEIAEESAESGLVLIRMKLDSGQSNHLKEQERALRLKVLLTLFQRHLEQRPQEQSNGAVLEALLNKQLEGLSEQKLTQAQLKQFIGSLKEQLADLSGYALPSNSLSRLLGLKYKHFELLNAITSTLRNLKAKASQIRAQGTEDQQIEAERLSAISLLTTNLELRLACLPNHQGGLPANAARTNQHLMDSIEEARERLHTLQAIVKNGGWGCIQKIKQKVTKLRELES